MYLEQKLENSDFMQGYLFEALKESFKKSGFSNKNRRTTIQIASLYVIYYTSKTMGYSVKDNSVLVVDNKTGATAKSKSKKDDVFNLDIGKAIALARLLKNEAVEKFFCDAPQPKKNVVGQIITFPKDDKEYHRKVTYQVDSVDTYEGNLTIIKDELASTYIV